MFADLISSYKPQLKSVQRGYKDMADHVAAINIVLGLRSNSLLLRI